MHALNIENIIKKMVVKDLMEFIYESYYKRINFTKADIR